MGKVLIISFDGLDYELIKEYNCKNIMQKEFGRIDNHTNIKNIITPELFASFLTGETSDTHGLQKMKVWNNRYIERLESLIEKLGPLNRFKRLRWGIYRFLGIERIPQKVTMQTLFDKIRNSKAINVPSYTTSPLFGEYFKPLQLYGSISDVIKLTEMEFVWVKSELWTEIDKGYDLLMAHFQKPDVYQHLFGTEARSGEYNEKKIRELYEEMDELARKIKIKAREKFDIILFMSDHGVPDKNSIYKHNENAFYSLNKKLNIGMPHITDFHDLILAWIGKKEEESVIEKEEELSEEEKEKIIERLKALGYID
jgi:hypothetical protein